jgi:hypothetical protein
LLQLCHSWLRLLPFDRRCLQDHCRPAKLVLPRYWQLHWHWHVLLLLLLLEGWGLHSIRRILRHWLLLLLPLLPCVRRVLLLLYGVLPLPASSY